MYSNVLHYTIYNELPSDFIMNKFLTLFKKLIIDKRKFIIDNYFYTINTNNYVSSNSVFKKRNDLPRR